MGKPRTETIMIRLKSLADQEAYPEFLRICRRNDTTGAQEIRKYVRGVVVVERAKAEE